MLMFYQKCLALDYVCELRKLETHDDDKNAGAKKQKSTVPQLEVTEGKRGKRKGRLAGKMDTRKEKEENDPALRGRFPILVEKLGFDEQ